MAIRINDRAHRSGRPWLVVSLRDVRAVADAAAQMARRGEILVRRDDDLT
jgi:hypothetical protein